jgi:tetratricopeptide (TPR) repeat protein
MARSTVFRYKGQDVDPQAVGRDLKVGAVLTGRVVQRGDTLIIGTELVDVENGWQLWGGQYNRKLSDIFAVQEEITKEISEKLRLRLTGGQKKRLTRHYTENTEAYQAYLKGRYFWNKFTGEALKKSIEHFQHAIEIDPNYALAYAGLADAYHELVGVHSPGEVMPKAKAAAMKALELDGTLAEAHAALGWVRWRYDWDWPEAEREFKRANELNPNYAIAYGMYAMFLNSMGRFDESGTARERARQLDPLSLIIDAGVGLHLYLARRHDEAIERYRKTIEMDPNFFVAHGRLGAAYEQKGMFEEAIGEFQKAITLSGGSADIVAELDRAYALVGRRGEAQKVLDDLTQRSKREYIPPHSIALLYAGLGEQDLAFAWLEKAYVERSGSLTQLKVDPELDSLRSDSRFQDLLHRVGLAP